MFGKGFRIDRVTIVGIVALSLASSGLWAAGPEREIAGIALGKPAALVLKKYGNPTRVIVGTVQRESGAQEAQVTMGPEMGPTRSMTMPGGLELPDIFRTGTLPGVAPGSLPSGPTVPGGYAPGTPATAGKTAEQQVTWRYEFASGISNGIALDFNISAGGTVMQITVSGRTPWPLSKTARGIKLGASYKEVLFKYGYPESHESIGSFLRTSYLEKYRVLFTFLGKGLVGITVALPSE